MTTSTPSMHVVKKGTHLRSRQCCHCDVKFVGEVGNYFEDVILDFDQPFMNCHLQVTLENLDELFESEANVVIGKVLQYQSNISRILATVLSIFILSHATIWSGVNSPGFNLRYSSQVFKSVGGSKDPGWTLTFLNDGHVVAPPLLNNQAEGKVMANEHSVGHAILNTCLCAQEDAFVAA